MTVIRARWAIASFLVFTLHGCGGMRAASPVTAQSESITNNQEAGVDEGGIVKAWQGHLVVLRRGRIFTVRLGSDDLTPVCMVDAFPPGANNNTWYDEMLIHDNHVVVVGYSYGAGATEIGLFDLDRVGCIRHRSTHFLRSHDYYSSRNYASRLVDGKLVFYLPHYLGHDIQPLQVASDNLPSVRRHDSSNFEPVISVSAMHVPEALHGQTTLHTVVTCDLSSGDLACRGRGILGGFGRSFYVSSRAVYVWVHEGRSGETEPAHAAVYRLPLDGSAPGALRAFGVPTDQFSFKEQENGDLDVLVRDEGYGDWMAGPEHVSGRVALAHFPSRAFARRGLPAVEASSYTALATPEGSGHAFQNRFVGERVLYGNGTSYGYAESGARSRLYVHRTDGQRSTAILDLPHGIDRIEALGEDAVVIGSDGRSLSFTSVALGAEPRMVDRFVREDARQGETRSHGFFFLEERPQKGVLGLPIQGNGSSGWNFLSQGSAEILYLKVDRLRFSSVGALASQPDRVDDHCVASCVDWYGNARPIFYRGRVFALLGYELVEGVIRRGRIVEVGRTHLMRDLRSAAPRIAHD